MSEKESKMIKHETVEYRGFESPEEVEQFFEKVRKEFEEAERRMETIFDATRQFYEASTRFHAGVDRMYKFFSRPSIEEEIEYHKRRIQQLEERKQKLLEAKKET